MNESTYAALSGVLAKLFPAALGAVLMAAVDHPKSRKEFFLRVFVAISVAYYMRAAAFDFIHSFTLFAWLDSANDDHKTAVTLALGAVSWFVLGAAAMMLRKLRADPPTAKELLP